MCIRLVDAALFISERLTAGTQEHVHHIVFEPDRTPHAVSVICTAEDEGPSSLLPTTDF